MMTDRPKIHDGEHAREMTEDEYAHWLLIQEELKKAPTPEEQA